MKKEVVIVVDMQKDFVTGCLGSEKAKKIVNPMIKFLQNWNGDIIFTRDTHNENYMNTQEGKNLPVLHCIENSDGWNIIDELQQFIKDDTKIFNKPTFGSVELASYLTKIGYEKITYIGVCTGICVISNAMLTKANMPETPISIIENLCACVSPESHKTAIETMKLCQITIETI